MKDQINELISEGSFEEAIALFERTYHDKTYGTQFLQYVNWWRSKRCSDDVYRQLVTNLLDRLRAHMDQSEAHKSGISIYQIVRLCTDDYGMVDWAKSQKEFDRLLEVVTAPLPDTFVKVDSETFMDILALMTTQAYYMPAMGCAFVPYEDYIKYIDLKLKSKECDL